MLAKSGLREGEDKVQGSPSSGKVVGTVERFVSPGLGRSRLVTQVPRPRKEEEADDKDNGGRGERGKYEGW